VRLFTQAGQLQAEVAVYLQAITSIARTGGSIAATPAKENNMNRTTLLFFVLAAILFFALAQLMATSIFPINPLPMTSAASGEEMYTVYCSSCHGRDARGVSAPDLTTLAKRNNGKFPMLLVKETIRGETRVDAHGPKDMPAWGAAFRYLGSGSRLEIDVRINNLTEYLKTLQEK
jgi:hypothetical protein